jgi:hypothetical protein
MAHGGFRSVFLLFGLSAGAAVVPPTPPPPVAVEGAAATPGPLTRQQIARLRGWHAPPFRPAADGDTFEDARAHAPPGGEGGTRPGAGLPPPAPALPALLATARRADPGPHWAPTLALAVLDLARRQAQAQAAEDEAALLLMLVLLEDL